VWVVLLRYEVDENWIRFFLRVKEDILNDRAYKNVLVIHLGQAHGSRANPKISLSLCPCKICETVTHPILRSIHFYDINSSSTITQISNKRKIKLNM
jgi:hypothetical protein